MPVSTKDNIPALCSADNCSAADTSIGDWTLTSFNGNAPSVSSLGLPVKHVDHEASPKPSSRPSPTPKRRVVSADTAAIENWRPHVSTIKEKSTDSVGSTAEQHPYPKGFEAKSPSKPQRQPKAPYERNSVANTEPRHVENNSLEISDVSFTTNTHGSCPSLRELFEKEPEETAAGEFSFTSLSRLPLFFARDHNCEKNQVHKGTPASSSNAFGHTPNGDFSFPSRSRLPLHAMPSYQQPALSHDDPPELDSLPPQVQSLVRKKLRPDAGEREHSAAAILIQYFSGHKSENDSLKLPSASRAPLYGSIELESQKQETGAENSEPPRVSNRDFDFSFSQRSRLPLHSIAGAEAKGAWLSYDEYRNGQGSKNSFSHFSFKRVTKLPPLSSLFKSPMESPLTGTRLAKNGRPLQVLELANSKKKGHLFGSIESVGEYIRPNAETGFLFSITPFSKLELRDKKKTKELLFGKLEKAGREQGKPGTPATQKPTQASRVPSFNPNEEKLESKLCNHRHDERQSTSSTTSSVQTVPRKKHDEGDRPEEKADPRQDAGVPATSRERLERQQSTEDRNRFDALVSRLQQKLSERTESDRRSTSTTMRRPSKARSGSDSQDRSASSSRTNTNVSTSTGSAGSEVNGQENAMPVEIGQLFEHGRHMNCSTIAGAGSSSITRTDKSGEKSSIFSRPATDSKETDQTSEESEQPTPPAASHDTAVNTISASPNNEAQVSAIVERSNHPAQTHPIPAQPAQPVQLVTNEGNWVGSSVPGQAPFNPLAVPFACPGLSVQFPPVGIGMLSRPGAWQALPFHPPPFPLSSSFFPQDPGHHVAPLPTVPPPVPAPAPVPVEHRWPMSKRPNHRKRVPYVALNAAEQQKIEEHIELLKSTVPNFATVSKRRQQIRWEREQGRVHQHRARGHVQQAAPYPPQPANWPYQQQMQQMQQQPPIPPQQMQPLHQGQQYHQQGHPMLAPQPSQPYYPIVQPNSTSMGMYTWPMPGMSMIV